MEHQTASFMGAIDEGLIVHELAHQWFGDKVTCASWNDVWLNEGFATYLSRIYFENKYPQDKIISRQQVRNFITSKPDGAVVVTDDMYDLARLFDNRLSYYKGSHLLYMLRWILGDATFFTAVKNYVNDPALAYGFATTNHLKSHLESASGEKSYLFFRSVVYRPGLSVLSDTMVSLGQFGGGKAQPDHLSRFGGLLSTSRSVAFQELGYRTTETCGAKQYFKWTAIY
jgi:aminopeptidase N